mmetsp:Transcript_19214/g.40126  ORF Transcript_19214/g.40126 Transcript_19214/m.40126 type:complete len:150 (-) Transcript_19214:402-851(-)
MFHLTAQEGLGRLLHFGEYHGGHFLWVKLLLLALELHLDHRLRPLIYHLERNQLHVLLDCGVLELAPDEALGVVDGVGGVGRRLVLSCVADQALVVARPRHVRRRDPVALVVRADLDAPVPVDADARVGRAEVDANAGRTHALAVAATA